MSSRQSLSRNPLNKKFLFIFYWAGPGGDGTWNGRSFLREQALELRFKKTQNQKNPKIALCLYTPYLSVYVSTLFSCYSYLRKQSASKILVSYVIKLNLRGILHFEFKQPLDHEIQIYRKSKWVMIFLIAQPIETNLDKKFLILVVSKFEKYR